MLLEKKIFYIVCILKYLKKYHMNTIILLGQWTTNNVTIHRLKDI